MASILTVLEYHVPLLVLLCILIRRYGSPQLQYPQCDLFLFKLIPYCFLEVLAARTEKIGISVLFNTEQQNKKFSIML